MKAIMKSLVLVLLLWLAAPGGAKAAMDIFVSIAPQQWLVEQVGGERVNVSLLVAAGQDPHTFEPLPRQVEALSASGLWYILGLEFEERLQDKVVSVAPGLQVIDMSSGVTKLTMEQDVHDHAREHHDEDGEDQEHLETRQDDGEEATDPHVWLSPPNLVLMAGVVAETLTDKDPEGADYYADRLKQLTAELTALHKELQVQLAAARGSSFFVYHPTFAYFADAYGLIQEPVEVEGKSPSPRQLAALIGSARRHGVKVIFVQPQFDPKAARAVASAIGGDVVPLDALAYDVKANLRVMAGKIADAVVK